VPADFVVGRIGRMRFRDTRQASVHARAAGSRSV
jgi:hypothetical protein